ncbi:MAG TPA: adenosylmethionine decarboxylase [Pyrinomonadaceae bacterium]|nr:adenosylmethionine decarboxylase [Pyrinomonadaceae bacterium]HMP67001.1 adenosylmethionine decarboxylase [Pyrinomonadaceae bacterium]
MRRIIGKHTIADVYGTSRSLLSDKAKLKEIIADALAEERFNILSIVGHKFSTEGEGVTLLVLLAESHASIHTYPEFNFASLDVYSCGDQDPESVVRAICKKLGVSFSREFSVSRVCQASSRAGNDLEGSIFVGLENYDHGDLDATTRFHFREIGEAIWGSYISDNITGGVFQGRRERNRDINLSWQHVSSEHGLVFGTSRARMQKDRDGRRIIFEDWRVLSERPERAGRSRLIEI